MANAQGSLEYMVIIAVVLAITGITAIFLSGVLGTQSSSVSVATCKQAADTCELSRMTSPNDPCLSCAAACRDAATGEEIFSGATFCCNHTMTDLIYTSSTACSVAITITSPTTTTASPVAVAATTDKASTCTAAIGSASPVAMAPSADGKSHSASITVATSGTYTLKVSCTDTSLGVINSASSTIVVNNLPLTLSLTSVDSTPPVPGYVNGYVTLTATPSDPSQVQSVRFYIDGYLFCTEQFPTAACTPSSDATSPFVFSWYTNIYSGTVVTPTSHSLRAEATTTTGSTISSNTVSSVVTNVDSPLDCGNTALSCPTSTSCPFGCCCIRSDRSYRCGTCSFFIGCSADWSIPPFFI